MANEEIENKVKKEWITEALGGLDLSPQKPIVKEDLDEEAVIMISGENMFGDPIYSYIKLTLRNFRKLRDAMQANENFMPSDFGEVVAAGRGEPSDEVRQEMAVTYKLVEVPKAPADNNAPRGFSQPKFFDND